MGEFAPVSIVVRSMDRPTLARALASIEAQSLKPGEIVVVAACGHSHGPIPDVVKSIPVRLILPEPGKARLLRPEAGNAGLRAATSDWIGFLDDDDELMSHHLSVLYPAALASYIKDKERGRLAYSLAQGVNEAGDNTDVYGRSFSFVQIWASTILHTMNGLFHRSLIGDGCTFDESLDIHEDWDFWLQCAQHTGFNYVERITSKWHGAEGESGCGFGGNYDGQKYQDAQRAVQQKWAAVRDRMLLQLTTHTRDAVAANARGDAATATRLCQLVLRQDPENVNAANVLGMISLYRGDVTSAHQLMTVAIANSPPHFGLYYNMGLIEDARDQPTVAREWFQKALALNPDHEGLKRKLASR